MRNYRLFLLLNYLLAVLLFALISYTEYRHITDATQAMARERGRTLFNLVELVRDWNARHGGVYAPVTESTQPNPYLEHPRRDVTATDGLALTMVNPAFMTRQMAEIAQQTSGVQMHITSLRPIRPANRADAWETAALQRFEARELSEHIELLEVAGHYTFRFMAPLLIKEPCLKCHQKQGYHIGDIRGGISVSMPADEAILLQNQRLTRSLLGYGLAILLLAGMVHWLVQRTTSHYAALQAVNAKQERIIAERTQSLSEANIQLRAEIMEHERAAYKLKIAATAVANACEGIMVTDEHNCILEVNPGFCSITGYAADEVLGKNPRMLSSGRHRRAFYADLWNKLLRDGRWQGEIWNRRRDGSTYPQWLTISVIGDPSNQHMGARYVASFTDITHHKDLEESLRFKAQTDPLTQLANRYLLQDRMGMAFNQLKRYGDKFVLMLLDLDHFKAVNDRMGHAAGDALLIETAQRLQHAVRETDTVARLGGDEFAVLLVKQVSTEVVHDIAQRIVDSLSKPFELAEGTAVVSCSLGVAFAPEHGEDPQTLTRSADRALYATKSKGRNGYQVFELHPHA